MAKAKESLEEGLDRSANKRHLTGKERHRYIGGALHNMGKSKPRSGGKSKTTTHKAASTATHKPAPSVSAPKKQAYSSPTLKKREHLDLIVKKNVEASKNKNYDVYSIYNKKTGKQHGSSQHRKRANATSEAKIEMDAANDIRGQYTRGRF